MLVSNSKLILSAIHESLAENTFLSRTYQGKKRCFSNRKYKKNCCVPRKVLAILVHSHLGALELVELAADGRLVAWRQPRPRLVRASVIIVSLKYDEQTIL